MRVFPGRRFLSGGRFLKTPGTFSEELEKIKTRGLVVLVTEPVCVSIGFCFLKCHVALVLKYLWFLVGPTPETVGLEGT